MTIHPSAGLRLTQSIPRITLVAAPSDNFDVPSGGCDSKEALTCIYGRIHCPPAEAPNEGEDGLTQIDVRNFIDALAEIALAVARRREGLDS